MQRINELNERADFKPRKPFSTLPRKKSFELRTRRIRLKPAPNFSDNPLNEIGEGGSHPLSVYGAKDFLIRERDTRDT